MQVTSYSVLLLKYWAGNELGHVYNFVFSFFLKHWSPVLEEELPLTHSNLHRSIHGQSNHNTGPDRVYVLNHMEHPVFVSTRRAQAGGPLNERLLPCLVTPTCRIT